GTRNSLPHQRTANARTLHGRINREWAEQERLCATLTQRDVPEPNGAEERAIGGTRNQRQAFGRHAPAPESLRRLALTLQAHGAVEQRFARDNILRHLDIDGEERRQYGCIQDSRIPSRIETARGFHGHTLLKRGSSQGSRPGASSKTLQDPSHTQMT